MLFERQFHKYCRIVQDHFRRRSVQHREMSVSAAVESDEEGKLGIPVDNCRRIKPKETFTRQMTEGEIARVLGPYKDASQIPDWAREAIATLIFEDLTNVDTATNRIEPLRPMTRGDIAYTLSQYLAKLQNPGTIPSIPLD